MGCSMEDKRPVKGYKNDLRVFLKSVQDQRLFGVSDSGKTERINAWPSNG